MKLLGSVHWLAPSGAALQGAAAVSAIVALGVLALACAVVAVGGHAGLLAGVSAQQTVRAALAGEAGMESLLASDPSSLLAARSGTLPVAYGAARQWVAYPLPSELVGLRLTVQWSDKPGPALILWTAVVR